MSNGILIFDRHETVRGRTRAYLEKEGFRICGETGDGHEAFAKTKILEPDIVVMDLTSAFDLVPELLKCSPSPKILIFTLHEGSEFSQMARLLGAEGFALKSEPNSLTAEVRRLLGEPLTSGRNILIQKSPDKS